MTVRALPPESLKVTCPYCFTVLTFDAADVHIPISGDTTLRVIDCVKCDHEVVIALQTKPLDKASWPPTVTELKARKAENVLPI